MFCRETRSQSKCPTFALFTFTIYHLRYLPRSLFPLREVFTLPKPWTAFRVAATVCGAVKAAHELDGKRNTPTPIISAIARQPDESRRALCVLKRPTSTNQIYPQRKTQPNLFIPLLLHRQLWTILWPVWPSWWPLKTRRRRLCRWVIRILGPE